MCSASDSLGLTGFSLALKVCETHTKITIISVSVRDMHEREVVWVARYCVRFKNVHSNKGKYCARPWSAVSRQQTPRTALHKLNKYAEDTKCLFIYSFTPVFLFYSIPVFLICCAHNCPSGFGGNERTIWYFTLEHNTST